MLHLYFDLQIKRVDAEKHIYSLHSVSIENLSPIMHDFPQRNKMEDITKTVVLGLPRVRHLNIKSSEGVIGEVGELNLDTGSEVRIL